MNIDCMMMNKNFKTLSAIVALSLLVGCNSEDAFSGSEDGTSSNQGNATAETIMAIEVTLSPENVAKGLTKQMVATATFSDMTSSDVSDSVTWGDFDSATATVSSTGLLTGVETGSTIVTAMMDGVTSNEVNVEVCEDLAGECTDIFDTGGGSGDGSSRGKLFVNTPSKAYLDRIDDDSATDGTVNGFYRFNWDNANALCTTYNTNSLSGRTNWRLPTSAELTDLFTTHGNTLNANGWPSELVGSFNLGDLSLYWSVTPDPTSTSSTSSHEYVYFLLGSDYSPFVSLDFQPQYASCVSDA